VLYGLMTDEEWAIFAPVLATPSAQGGRPPSNHRRVLDGIFWIVRTGAPWRELPVEFGKWNSVWRQFRRWYRSGIWGRLLQALADGGSGAHLLQMIDSTIGRGHRCAAGESGTSGAAQRAMVEQISRETVTDRGSNGLSAPPVSAQRAGSAD
jgi:transposase